MATIDTFLMHGHNYVQFFKKNKDFDHILFEHSMLLNCKIEKEHIFRKNILVHCSVMLYLILILFRYSQYG